MTAVYVGLHATDVLNLQNEMQTYHEYTDGIPEYINKLEDAQKQSTRSGNLITDPNLLLFVANAMLRIDRLPRSNEIWEELPGVDRTWARWKEIYQKADMAKKVKKTVQADKTTLGHMVPLIRRPHKNENCRNCPS